MERMLVILKNARSLQDQFILLNNIVLDNYGAYYASRYEDFKAVCQEMRLQYDPDKQNKKLFSVNYKHYRVALDEISERHLNNISSSLIFHEALLLASDGHHWLVDCTNPLPQPLNLEQLKAEKIVVPFEKKQFVPPYQLYRNNVDGSMTLLLAENPQLVSTEKQDNPAPYYRFIGLQSSGIYLHALIKEIKYCQNRYLRTDATGELLASIFLASHERFVDNDDEPLFVTLASISKNFILYYGPAGELSLCCPEYDAMLVLGKLYKRDIKLNQVEGLMLFKCISQWSTGYFEDTSLDRSETIKKLLSHLEQHTFATIKLFNFKSKRSDPKWILLYYVLDTAAYLAKDPVIAATYHEDLWLFSGMIHSVLHEVADEAVAKRNIEKVRQYLHQAAIQEKPNNLGYAVQVMLNAKDYFTFAGFIAACDEIAQLPLMHYSLVDTILHKNGFTRKAALPEIFTKDDAYLKGNMISFIILLDEMKKKAEHLEILRPSLDAELALLPIAQLHERLQKAWEESGTLLSVTASFWVGEILKQMKEHFIQAAFGKPKAQSLLGIMAGKITYLSDFQDDSDFEKVNRISNRAEQIAQLFKQLLKSPAVKNHEQSWVVFFDRLDFSEVHSEALYSLLILLTQMPQRNNLRLLEIIFASESKLLYFVEYLTALNNACFPTEYLEAFGQMMVAHPDATDVNLMIQQMIQVFDKDPKDPVLGFLLSHASLTYKEVMHLLEISQGIAKNRHQMSDLFNQLAQTKELDVFFEALSSSNQEKRQSILRVLSQGYAMSGGKNTRVSYIELASLLNELSDEERRLLKALYDTAPVSADCLFNALKHRDPLQDFKTFLLTFEKAPFGERDLKQQFSVTEMTRIINESKDMHNESIYTYQYRKQWMEAFLFVNAIGDDLPVYDKKAAKDLTNAEIQSFFAQLKAKKIPGLTPFQNRLLALGLMREAMYRATGEFPYAMQILALIDGMMHSGDFISNIDTGQGKSLIDSMKAALLWLDSDRVELTTSSLVDAKRDVANYGPFSGLLGIPYSKDPISSSSSIETFKKDGINFSTFGQLSLFFDKAKVTGQLLETPDTSVSLVMNESDYTILDDRVVYRFATVDGSGVGYGQEWIYYVLNDFVTRPEFLANDKSAAGDDIEDLKAYLRVRASGFKKSAKIVDKFSDAQYLTLLESALTVNYVLKENEDYVIPDELELKVINGVDCSSRVVKVLQRDGKVSPDSTFGNGIQQLLYARLNQDRRCTDFVIEPQNKTIISTNNTNLINAYRARKGFIWGSSGTVGSRVELEEQYRTYGFEFSKEEPHQKNQVQFNQPVIEKNEQAQLNRLISQLKLTSAAASIVFCQDIATAKRFYEVLEKYFPEIQLYTGVGKEESVILKAREDGMITVATSALGRNTDIHYDKTQGLRVWHTFVDSIRGTDQKSGRTGRQGSAGEVHWILNEEKLGGKTIQEIQAQMDVSGSAERNLNDDLYQILGYLLTQVEKQSDELFEQGKRAFLRTSWSQFSDETERQYRKMRHDENYNQDAFFQTALDLFNKRRPSVMPEENLASMKHATERRHQKKNTYKPYTANVAMEDCIPPIDIAYHLLPSIENDDQVAQKKTQIKEQLKQLFVEMKQDTFVDLNRQYLKYLAAYPTTQAVIVEAHKEFLDEFLQEHSQKLSFVQRWFGLHGQLNKIASNPHYLMMFHALAHTSPEPVVRVDRVKQLVCALLDEYVETGWFIHQDRKQSALDLKNQIYAVEDMDALVGCLSKTQIEVGIKDIETSKKSLFKTLHFFGHSRYQSTLSHALNLALSLSGKTHVNALTKGLKPLIEEVTDHQPMDDLTIDALKHRASGQKVDGANASVLLKALESALMIKNQETPLGMLGRLKS